MKNIQYIFLVFNILLIGILGCGKAPNPDGREDISGTITLNGEPIRTGIITFISATGSGQDGEAGGSIIDGEFFLTGQDGVKPGDYKVRIIARDEYDSQTNALATEATTPERLFPVDLIPAKYNRNTELTFSVQKGGENVYDYDIVADPPKLPKRR